MKNMKNMNIPLSINQPTLYNLKIENLKDEQINEIKKSLTNWENINDILKKMWIKKYEMYELDKGDLDLSTAVVELDDIETE